MTRTTIVIMLLTAIFVGCDKSEKENLAVTDYYKVEIEDSLVVSIIRDYAKENELDPLKEYAYFEIQEQYGQDFITVSSAGIEFGQYGRTPSFYAVVDSFLVVIYSDLDGHLKKTKIKSELTRFSVSKNMELKDGFGIIVDPPIWRAVRCEEGDIAVYRTNKYPREIRGVPCGYRLFRSVEKYDSLYLIKE
jgi:hypothetical protein